MNYLPTCTSRLVVQQPFQVSFKSMQGCRRSWEDKIWWDGMTEWRKDGMTEWRTKQTLNAPLPFYGGGIKKFHPEFDCCGNILRKITLIVKMQGGRYSSFELTNLTCMYWSLKKYGYYSAICHKDVRYTWHEITNFYQTCTKMFYTVSIYTVQKQ